MIAIFTKFDAQIIQEYVKLDDTGETKNRWDKARANAEDTFKEVYLSKVLGAGYPPRACVKLEGENDKHFCCRFKWDKSV